MPPKRTIAKPKKPQVKAKVKPRAKRAPTAVRIPIGHPGELKAFGYAEIKHLSLAKRRAALRAAVKRLGATHVFRKLNAVSTLTRRTSTESSSRFNADKQWVKKTFMTAKK